MKINICLSSDTLIAYRSQFGDTLDKADGEAGYGIYAHLPSATLLRYYSKNGENVFKLTLNKNAVIDYTTATNMAALLVFAKSELSNITKTMQGYIVPKVNNKNIQRFGNIITRYTNLYYPNAKAYIIPHYGPGIPTGKQVVITDESAISKIEKMA